MDRSTSTGRGRQPDDPRQAEEEFHLPGPSVWPVTLATGTGLVMFGIVVQELFSVFGLLVIAFALAGWVRELLHD